MRHPQGAPPSRRKRLSLGLVMALVAVVGTASIVAVGSAGTAKESDTINVGLITKDVTNPFFVKMKAGATAQAKKLGAQLLYAGPRPRARP
jgi:ABC-type sugar transport system substrate-binding protein